MADIVDTVTGEVISNKFAKMFFEDIGRLFDLTSMQKNLLFIMARDALYSNRINMTPARKKGYVAELGYKSQNSLNSGLKALEVANVVKREEDGATAYLINPEIMFKGNDYQRSKIIIKYTDGKRHINVMKTSPTETHEEGEPIDRGMLELMQTEGKAETLAADFQEK